MFFIIGFIVVFGSVVGGYLALGGHLDVLWQPFEFVIIGGAAIGQLLIASPKRVIGGLAGSFGVILKGSKYNKDSYLELLSVLYSVVRLAKSKGDLALETHVEKPDESTIFAKFPMFTSDHHAVEFLCDYLRLLTLGASTSHEVEAVMEQELWKPTMPKITMSPTLWQPWVTLSRRLVSSRRCLALFIPWARLPNRPRFSAI
jgi:chemotaxis protein MotA